MSFDWEKLRIYEIEYSGKLPPAYQYQTSYNNWGIDDLLEIRWRISPR